MRHLNREVARSEHQSSYYPGGFSKGSVHSAYDPFAERRGVYVGAAEGRDVLGKKAAANYKRVRSLCPEDVQNLETRIRTMLDTARCP